MASFSGAPASGLHKSQNIAESILSLLCCALLRVRDRRGSCKSFGCRLLLGTPRCLPVLGYERVRVKIRCAMATPTANAGHRKVLAIPYGAQFFASSSTLRELLLKPLLPLVLAAFSVALFLRCQKILSFHLERKAYHSSRFANLLCIAALYGLVVPWLHPRRYQAVP